MIREAKAASKLSHPNIVTIYAVEQADQRHFITMEYVDGRSLKELTSSTIDLSWNHLNDGLTFIRSLTNQSFSLLASLCKTKSFNGPGFISHFTGSSPVACAKGKNEWTI